MVHVHPTAPDARPTTVDQIVEQFLDGALDPDSWTHPAHLFVCRHVLATSMGPAEALDRLRPLIQAHNRRVGLRPGHGAYHETVTRYFVEAMAHANPPSIAAVLVEPSLRRDAPSAHWSAAVLASPAAQERWVAPDLRPLPWPTSIATPT